MMGLIVIFEQGTGTLGILYLTEVLLPLGKRHLRMVARFVTDGEVSLYHDNSPKLATTATGIDVTGTVTADGLTVDGDISATGGAVDLDTLDLNAIAASKAVTAVDVFVYDTSKDSDGGAWRKRTQGTSWYNETLNTATRGSRREFPAVAVIVAEATKVTIYDGDDPALPMWMVFNGYIGGSSTGVSTVRAVTALNGEVNVATSGASNDYQSGLPRVRFIKDVYSINRGSVIDDTLVSDGQILNRNVSAFGPTYATGQRLVSGFCNDVAMTVLPNAPIDPATGLPVPTIAVATAGGVSVIKDDGTVVDIVFTSNNTVTTVDFDPSNNIWFLHGGNASLAGALKKYAIPDADLTAQSPTSGGLAFYSSVSVPSTSVLPAIYPVTRGIISNKALGANNKLVLLDEDPATKANGMVAYTTSTYNTGWMNGDIKGAFLSDTDDTDLVGAELVTNGTFDTDTTGWSNTSATIASVSGELQVSNQTDSPSATTQTVSGLVVGKVYAVTATYSQTGTGGTAARVSFFGILSENNSTSTPVTKTIYATATQTTATLSLQSFGTSSTISHFDNVSVKLADADRSVNNKGLIVNGTVTRTAVATGADLVAYSGFSASNYLEQPYNSALDFGTGDFCVMGWVKPDATASRTFISYEGGQGWQLDNYASSLRFWEYTPGGGNKALASATASTALQFICVVVTGGVVSMYVNGARVASGETTTRSFSNGTLRVGKGQSFLGYNAANSQLSLIRISATAPTAEQIAKIYNDEKFLFQDNAQATLYGASDAVTALAHDDATNLLHVGTSAGRSVFQGLRRVENTTTAVGTAISASNSLVVEE
jgi:trimeric autotransporter adhesin